MSLTVSISVRMRIVILVIERFGRKLKDFIIGYLYYSYSFILYSLCSGLPFNIPIIIYLYIILSIIYLCIIIFSKTQMRTHICYFVSK